MNFFKILIILSLLVPSISRAAADPATPSDPNTDPAAAEKAASAKKKKEAGAAGAVVFGAAAYKTRGETVFKNSVSPRPISDEDIKEIKDKVTAKLKATEKNPKHSPVLSVTLNDNVRDETSLVEKAKTNVLGIKEVRTSDIRKDAPGKELTHLDEQLNGLKANGDNVLEVTLQTRVKSIINKVARVGLGASALVTAGANGEDVVKYIVSNNPISVSVKTDTKTPKQDPKKAKQVPENAHVANPPEVSDTK